MENDAARPGDDEPILFHVDGAVATVTINRPAVRNALNLACWYALGDCARRLAADADVRVVVLAGRGDVAFSAGADISEFPTQRLELASATRYNAVVERSLDAWSALPQPIVARIAGFCLGAGLELVLTADFRLAAEGSTFGVPATKRGFGISLGDARRLVDVVGVARARALLLTGETIPAQRALSIGLVDEVVSVRQLESRIDALEAQLIANAPLAVAWVKRAVDAAAHPDAVGTLTDAEALGAHVFATRDCAEGAEAFLERRPTQFRGE